MTLYLTGPELRRIAFSDGTDDPSILSTLDGDGVHVNSSVPLHAPNMVLEDGHPQGTSVNDLKVTIMAQFLTIQELTSRLDVLTSEHFSLKGDYTSFKMDQLYGS